MGLLDAALGQGWSLDSGTVVAVLVGLGLLGLIALLFALLLLSRRQLRNDLRELVLAIEDLRSGQTHGRAEVSEGSPLALLADSVNRLGQALGTRWNEAGDARERLEAVLDAARDFAVVGTNRDGDIRSFSPGASALFGWAEEEVLGRPVAVLFEEASWKDLLPKLARRAFREHGVESRVQMVRRDGVPLHASVDVRNMSGTGAGEASGYLMLARDIGAQVRLEDELRDAEARYRSLVEGLSEGVFIAQGGSLLYANPALHRLCGVAPGALAGRPVREWVATRDLFVVEERLALLERIGEGMQDLRFTWLDSAHRAAAEVRVQASAIRQGGRPSVLGLVIDETAERRLESELRHNEARLDAVLEATSDGLLVLADTSAGAVVRMTNRAFLAQFGLAEGQVLGLSEGELLRLLRDRGQGAEDAATFIASAGTGRRVEAIVLGGDSPRVIELELSSLEDRKGTVDGRVLATRDLTDQKAFEGRLQTNADELRKSKEALEDSYRRLGEVNQDLERRTHELDSLNRELQKLNTMKSELLANVSHELQTPLVSIRGYTEMILKGRLGAITEEQKKGLTLSLKNIDRLISMIDNLLAFSRLDRDAVDLNLSSFPLRPLIDESLEVLRSRLEGRQIVVSLRFADPEVRIQADREKILQVFLNLLSNAIKFNREDGKIEIAAGVTQPGYVLVRVRDTGIGIPKEDLERIFDRFYQSRKPAGEREGTGIGLSIVRSILNLHGCSIQVESEPGRGTTFQFTLPLPDGLPREEPGPPRSMPPGAPPPREPSSGAHPGRNPYFDSLGPQAPRLRIIRH